MAWRLSKPLVALIAVVALILAASVLYLRKSEPQLSSVSSPAPMPIASSADARAPSPVPSVIYPRGATVTDLRAMVSSILQPDTTADIRASASDLLTGDEEKRTTAIGELGFLDDSRWLPVVIAVLAEDPSASVRSAAAAALATQNSSPAVHALTAALSDPDSGVREDALLSLKAIRNSVVEQDLRQLLTTHQLDDDTTHNVRLFLDRYYIDKDPLADPLAN